MPSTIYPKLIQSLRDPACYPHRVDSIRICETHISWVLLTGPYAYKIKKPVRFSFLDFSTLALRRKFCAEELRLNRRFAPTLYLDVVAIGSTPAGPRVGCDPAIEFAVKLKQFATQDELPQLIAADAVRCTDLAQFGEHLAHIHSGLPAADRVSLAEWQRTLADNVNDVRTLDAIDRAKMQSMLAALDRLQTRIRPLLEQRHSARVARECHGDMHCGNIVRVDGQLKPFDCIEFDARLRNIDPLNDSAFLVMDLEAQGRRDLAYCFLNAWLETSGEYAALPLLPFYAAHRALVRLKVAALSDAPTRQLHRYFAEADRRTHQSRGMIVLTCGLSGSGKTWFGKQLAPQLPAIQVRSDVERKRLAGLSALANSESAQDAGIYDRDFNRRTYARLTECARAAAQAGETIIVDAAYLRRDERLAMQALACELDVAYAVVHCSADRETLQSRIRQREAAGGDASEATVEVLKKQYDYWEPFGEDESTAVIQVDPHTDLSQVLATLQRRRTTKC